MPRNQTEIKAVITVDDKDTAKLKNFGTKTSKIGSVIAAGMKTAVVGLTGATIAATAFGASAVKSFSDSEDAIAQTNAVLKSTGGIAGVTAKEVDKLSSALQKTTKFSDEEVRSAQNLLLTFTSIGKNVFPQATKTVLDMSQALGQDLKSSSVQLGKALQDPILGVSALRRVGVNFSKDQQEVIKSLVESGKKSEAQKLILKELKTEFGGAAEAAGNTFSGSLVKLRNRFDDVKETIGGLIASELKEFVKFLNETLDAINWEAVIQATIGGLGKFKTALVLAAEEGRDVIKALTQAFMFLKPSLEALITAVRDSLIPILTDLWKNVIAPMIPIVGGALVIALKVVIDTLTILINILGTWHKALKDGNILVMALTGALVGLGVAFMMGKSIAAFNAALAFVTNTTIPKMMLKLAALKTLITTPMVMPAIIITAAIFAIQAVVDKFKKAIEQIQDNEAKIKRNREDAAQIKRIGERYRAGEIDKKTMQKLVKIYADDGFASGGFTGRGGANEPAGVVHKGEYVLPKPMVDQNTGTPKQMGNTTNNFNVYVGVYTGSEMEKRKLAREIFQAARDYASAHNISPMDLLGGKNVVHS